jgi:hypothetical protein
MPSPFPGMDPYLEHPGIWPDFHNALATHLRDALNRTLPAPYYALMETREELGLMGEPSSRVVIPDVLVSAHPSATGASNGGVATVISAARTEVSPRIEFEIDSERVQLNSVEIRDAHFGHEIVTLIEILSPSNKLGGADREKYLQKRREILASPSSLIEIDLLREGERAWTEADYAIALQELIPRPDYLITVNRGWKRAELARLNYQVFSISVQQTLPAIPVPLRKPDREPILDLQYLFEQVYDGGAYRRGAIDYSNPPIPPLPLALREWCAERVRQAFGQTL